MEEVEHKAPPRVKRKGLPNEFTPEDMGPINVHGIDWITALSTVDIPKVLEYDRENKKWICKSQALLDFFSIVTNGDPKWVKAYFRSQGKFRSKILSDVDGRIRMFLLANAMKRAQEGDVSFSKHALEIIRECDQVNLDRRDHKRSAAKERYIAKTTESEKRKVPGGLRDLD